MDEDDKCTCNKNNAKEKGSKTKNRSKQKTKMPKGKSTRWMRKVANKARVSAISTTGPRCAEGYAQEGASPRLCKPSTSRQCQRQQEEEEIFPGIWKLPSPAHCTGDLDKTPVNTMSVAGQRSTEETVQEQGQRTNFGEDLLENYTVEFPEQTSMTALLDKVTNALEHSSLTDPMQK